jgi:hypothetical protein
MGNIGGETETTYIAMHHHHHPLPNFSLVSIYADMVITWCCFYGSIFYFLFWNSNFIIYFIKVSAFSKQSSHEALQETAGIQ